MSEKKVTTEDTTVELSFEEALKKLEETVSLLESGKAPLDASMQYYEEGVKLVRLCSDKLTSARQKITLISEEDNA